MDTWTFSQSNDRVDRLWALLATYEGEEGRSGNLFDSSMEWCRCQWEMFEQYLRADALKRGRLGSSSLVMVNVRSTWRTLRTRLKRKDRQSWSSKEKRSFWQSYSRGNYRITSTRRRRKTRKAVEREWDEHQWTEVEREREARQAQIWDNWVISRKLAAEQRTTPSQVIQAEDHRDRCERQRHWSSGCRRAGEHPQVGFIMQEEILQILVADARNGEEEEDIVPADG